MRVILSAAYCNPKRSESLVDLVLDDFENNNQSNQGGTLLLVEEEENASSSTTAHDVENAGGGESSLSINNRFAESLLDSPSNDFYNVSNASSGKSSDHCNNELERKLPATKVDEPCRKRKLPTQLEQLPIERTRKNFPTEVNNNDSTKPAAKMTAGRDASDDRDPPPPPYHEQDENTIYMVEYDDPTVEHRTSNASSSAAIQQRFVKALRERGLEIRQQEGDGNCLFRAVSLQVYGDPSMHMDVRNQCLDHMAKDQEHFAHFVEDEDFSSYLRRKRTGGVHGNNPEIQAISELFNRPVEVFTPENGATPLNIFQSDYKTSDVPIRLSYQDNHYDAVVDPLLPTAGLGLGLPGLQPGLADKMQMEKAVRESDQMADQAELKRALEESHNDELQRAIKESSLAADQMFKKAALTISDLEAANFDLEQAVLESSLEAFRQHESGRKQGATSARYKDSENKSSMGLAHHHHVLPVASSAPAPLYAAAVAPVAATTASFPEETTANAWTVSMATTPVNTGTDEYPPTVQELVMNGFDLSRVIHAYELIGDNFDDLLSFLISTSST